MEISIQNFVKLNPKSPLLLIILEKSIILTFLTILTFVTPVARRTTRLIDMLSIRMLVGERERERERD